MRSVTSRLACALVAAAVAFGGSVPRAGAAAGANDAPVLDGTRSPALASQAESDPAPIGVVGTPISSLVDFAVPVGQVDNVVDGDCCDGDVAPVVGIAVIGADATNGTWYYTINGGTNWNLLGAVSDTSARLLAGDLSTRLFFRPNTGFSGTIESAITFRAWDRTSGGNGSLATTAPNGGTSAFSTATDVASIGVAPSATIAFRSASSDAAASGDTTLTFPQPAGLEAGDAMVAAVAVRPQTATITAPSGWTLIRRTDNSVSTSNSLATYYRIATSSEPLQYHWLLGGSPTGAVGGIEAFAKAHPTNPIDVHAGNPTPSSVTHIAPSVTPTVSRAMLVTWHSFASGANWTPPSGMTEAIDTMSVSGDSGVALEGNYLLQPAAAPTGTKAATASALADTGNAHAIALRPGRSNTNSAPVADFDGNGSSDVAIYRPSSNDWYVRGGLTSDWGTAGDVAVPGDYNGDRSAEVAIFGPSTGTWDVQGGATTSWGTGGDIPVPGDYDGNGNTDIAIFRPSSGIWFIRGGTTTSWGTSGDVPVPGDYDGNGSTDIAIFRPSTGTWYVQGGATTSWGTDGDIPVPGDYDGNSSTDIAVFRPSTGTWFVRGGTTAAWGTSGDVPAPGDFDGNGSTDIAVFRPSSGQWWVRNGATTAWGIAGDQPLVLPPAVRLAYFG